MHGPWAMGHGPWTMDQGLGHGPWAMAPWPGRGRHGPHHAPHMVTATRCLEAVEYMALQGWDVCWWQWSGGFTWRHLVLGDNPQKFVELIASMAGNAMSIWQYVPIHLAAMATVGHFYCEGARPTHRDTAQKTSFAWASSGLQWTPARTPVDE